MQQTARMLREASGSHAEGLALIGRHLDSAAQSYGLAVDFVLANIRDDTRAVFHGSVPCLMLAGLTHAGWQLGRSALAAAQQIESGSNDVVYTPQIATAVAYAVDALQRTGQSAEDCVGKECVSKCRSWWSPDY